MVYIFQQVSCRGMDCTEVLGDSTSAINFLIKVHLSRKLEYYHIPAFQITEKIDIPLLLLLPINKKKAR